MIERAGIERHRLVASNFEAFGSAELKNSL